MQTTFQSKRKRTNGGRKAPAKKSKKSSYNRTGGYAGRFTGSNAELKFHDLDLDLGPVTTGGTIIDSINEIVQGVTESTRVGRKLVIRKLGWKYLTHAPVVSGNQLTTASEVCRVIMFLDKQCNGATAAVLDLLETADFQSFRNLANTQRFNVLMDRTYDLNPHGASGDGTANDSLTWTCSDDFYKDVNIPIEFDGTDGTIGTITSNNIGVLLISQRGAAQFFSKIRVRFSDGG